jgi:tRNA A37 methylthiotransferase MiaB
MKEQIPEPIKHARVEMLSQKAAQVRNTILDTQIGRVEEVLFETFANGTAKGHTKNFLEVICPAEGLCRAVTLPVRIDSHDGTLCHGTILFSNQD